MIDGLRQLVRRRNAQKCAEWKCKGNDLLARGALAEAIRCYRAAAEADPHDAAAHLNLGFALLEHGSVTEAGHALREALRLQPTQHEAHFLLARAARAQGALEAAAQGYAQAALHAPSFELARSEGSEVCVELGQALHRAGRHEEALQRFREALQRSPGKREALLGEADALLALRREEEALVAYHRAFDAFPDRAMGELNRGNVLQSLRRVDEAAQSFRRALQLRPGFVEALVNLGGVLYAQNRFAEALQAYDQALALDPGNAAAHWSRSLPLLVQGRFEEGWREAEWRRQALGLKPLPTTRPQWTGTEPLAGKTILVHAEQGFGDTLQFCRYVPLLVQRGAHVVFGVQQPVEGVMETLPGPFRLLRTGEAIPQHDYHCPLLSLPLAFATTLASIPAKVPYLASRPERVARWRDRLGGGTARRVGIAWSGNPAHVNDRNRSVPLETLLQIASAETQLVSLQKEVRAHDAAVLRDAGLPHFGDSLANFEDTAALIACMDLVVTVDTSIAHLAGALGKPVWILLPFSPDWRWLLDRGDSPWYPTARLFRQQRAGDWDAVVAAVREGLQAL